MHLYYHAPFVAWVLKLRLFVTWDWITLKASRQVSRVNFDDEDGCFFSFFFPFVSHLN